MKQITVKQIWKNDKVQCYKNIQKGKELELDLWLSEKLEKDY